MGATIGGQLSCRNGSFENAGGHALNADGIRVGGSVIFDEGFHAQGAVRLVGATINGQLACQGGSFENAGGEALLLQGAQISDALFWTELAKPPEGDVDLAAAQVGVLEDDERAWPVAPHRLNLDGFSFGAFAGRAPLDVVKRLDWLNRQRPEEFGFRPRPYEQLAAVYERMGHDREARAVRIAKQRARHRWDAGSWFGKLGDRFLDITIGYGWAPWRPVWFGVAMVLFGWLIFLAAGAQGVMRPAEGASTVAAELQLFVYALDTFLPVIDFGVESDWTIDTTRAWFFLNGSWVEIYRWLHIAMGWIVSTLAVVALTGLVRRT